MSLERSKLNDASYGELPARSTQVSDLEKLLDESLDRQRLSLQILDLAKAEDLSLDFRNLKSIKESMFDDQTTLLNYLNDISSRNKVLTERSLQELHTFLTMTNRFAADIFDPDLQRGLRDKLKEEQIRLAVKNELQQEMKEFHKQLMDKIEYEILEAQYAFKSLDYFRECLKFMLSRCEKGSMMFISTLAMMDSLNVALPNLANNIHSLQSNKVYLADQINQT